MSKRAVYDTMLFLQAASRPDRTHASMRAVNDGNLAIEVDAEYLVTWETRILKLATEVSPAANMLRRLAPNLNIITPNALAERLQRPRP